MSASKPKDSQEKNMTQMQLDHAAWRDAQPTVVSCMCGEFFEGTAAEGREWAKAHRDAKHPELAKKPRRHLSQDQQRERAMLRSEWRRRKAKGED